MRHVHPHRRLGVLGLDFRRGQLADLLGRAQNIGGSNRRDAFVLRKRDWRTRRRKEGRKEERNKQTRATEVRGRAPGKKRRSKRGATRLSTHTCSRLFRPLIEVGHHVKFGLQCLDVSPPKAIEAAARVSAAGLAQLEGRHGDQLALGKVGAIAWAAHGERAARVLVLA